jgi:hypothetical protein
MKKTHQELREEAMRLLPAQDLVLVHQALSALHQAIDPDQLQDPFALQALERLVEVATREDTRRIMSARNAALANVGATG